LVGYFTCGQDRGILLCFFFFFFAKEVLNRGISKLISKKLMLPMVDPWGIQFPSHTLHANDILVFCIGDTRTLQHLKSFFMSLKLSLVNG